MKDFLSKKHHPYKIHTLLMIISAYPPIFTEKNLDLWFFQKPPINKRRVPTMVKL